MPSKDYLIRQIEELGIFLGILLRKLMKMKEENQSDQIESLVFNALKGELNIDLSQLVSLENENFLDELTRHFRTNDQLEKIAAILKAMGEGNVSSFTLTKINYLQKSFILYNYLQETSSDFSMERQNQILQINDQLRLWGFSPVS
jgi:hypothetical protein